MTTPTPTTAIPEHSSAAPTTSAPAQAAKAKKNVSKSKNRRARRRGAEDSDSDQEAANQHSDGSASDSSISDHSDSEEENDVDVPPSSSKATATSSAFADTNSTTPAAWKPADPSAIVEEVSFDAFNRGESGVVRGSSAKRGRGGKGSDTTGREGEKEKKVFTEEQTRKYEEKKAKMKERQKEKKRERAAAKKKELEEKGAAVVEPNEGLAKPVQPEASSSKTTIEPKNTSKEPSKKGKAKAKAPTSNTEAEVINGVANLQRDKDTAQRSPSTDPATTDASTPDNAAARPPTGPRAIADRRPKDPRVTPRAGGFWTHDQRNSDLGHHHDQGFYSGRGSWRGRGEPFRGARGGFRGRGRGGFGFAPAGRGQWEEQGGARGQELTEPEAKVELLPDGGKTLEMDKLEAELERKREAAQAKARAESEAQAQPQPQPTVDAQATDASPEKVAADETVKQKETATPPPPRQAKEPKWGHEGFESMQAVQQFQANRLNIRGRGRGRAFFGGRGGFIPRGPYHNLPTPQHTPNPVGAKLPSINASAPTRPSPLNVNNPVTPTEETSTQPTVESLLDSETVKVKIPGAEDVDLPADTREPSLPHPAESRPASSNQGPVASSSTIRASAPAFVAPRPRPAQPSPIPFNPPVFSDGTASPQPFPANGSENGSISSNGHFVPPYPAQAVGVAPNGDYYPIANGNPRPPYRSSMPTHQRQLYAGRSYPSQPQVFYPQSYSPDPYQPHPTRHDSFGSQGGFGPDGRVSPYPVYSNGTVFFAQPRQSKVQIKAPDQEAASSEEADLQRYASIDQSQGHPGQAMPGLVEGPGGAYYAQHYNPYAGGNMGYMPGGAGGWATPAGMGYMNDGYDYGY